ACLGAGNYGAVCQAVDISSGEQVAVKRVPRGHCSEMAVKDETSILRELSGSAPHRNIIGLKGVYADAGAWYIVMELARGRELYERLVTQGMLTQAQARAVLHQLACAVAHLHAHATVHADIKPENVLLHEEEEDNAAASAEQRCGDGGSGSSGGSGLSVKLVDFGSAFRVGTGPPKRKEWSYTAVYSPPEVVAGTAEASAAGDVWALGVVAYILLLGVHPFDPSGDTCEAEVLRRVVSAEPDYDDPAWDLIDAGAKDLVQGALNKDPALRPTAAQLLAHPWVAAAAAACTE
ncbi:kinase-like domain-containing protein, partial [Tribonema minus]